MKAIILFFFFAYTSLTAQVTQEWIATYNGIGTGGNYADKAAVDNFGNFIVAGRSDSITTDYIILKYNSSGNLLWSRRYDGIAHSDEALKGMILDDSGNIYITGANFEGDANGNINWLTMKYDTDGNIVWKKSLDWTFHKEDVPFSITLDKLNNVYVAGYGWAPPSPYQNFDMVVAKYNGITGDVIYTQSYNSFEYIADWGYSVVTDDSCNAYVSGYAKLRSNPSLDVIATVKYDSAGNQMWVREFLRANPEYAIPLYSKIDKENNVIICGNYNGNTDFITVKYNSQGDLLWSRYFNGIGNRIDICNAMFIDDSSNVYICGRSEYPGRSNDMLLIKYKSNGDTSFIIHYDNGDSLREEANSLSVDNLGNIYIAGSTTIVGDDFLTMKYSSGGQLIWFKTYTLPRLNSLYGIGLDQYNNVYVAGYSDTASRSRIICLKYSQVTGNSPGETFQSRDVFLKSYPNPFNSESIISYEIPTSGDVKIIIFDNSGKQIDVIEKTFKQKGIFEIRFNGSNYASGVYYTVLFLNNRIVKTNKMFLIK